MIAPTRHVPEDEPQSTNQGSDIPDGNDDPVAKLRVHLAELSEYVSYYLAIQFDRSRYTVKRLLFYAGLGAVGAISGATIVIVASVFLVAGLATGLGEWLGGRIWLGQLIVGAVILSSIGLGGFIWVRRRLQKFSQDVANKFEHRKQSERARFGRDVSQRTPAEAQGVG